MLEQGVVTRTIPPDMVEISLPASEACGRCGACHPVSGNQVCIEAVGIPGAKTGDAVEFEISAGGVVATSFVVYLLPVVFLLVGYMLGAVLARLLAMMSGETGGIAGALLLFAFSFWVIHRYDRYVRRRGTLRARVIRVLPEEDLPVKTDDAPL
jgi:sigma-E factor negative regulatory protein RseC